MSHLLRYPIAAAGLLGLILACGGAGDFADADDDFRCDSFKRNLQSWPEGKDWPSVVVSAETKVKGRQFPCDDRARQKCTLSPGEYHPNGGPGEYQFIGKGPIYKVTREVTLKDYLDNDGPTLQAGDTLELTFRGPEICFMMDSSRNSHEVKCPGSFDDGLELQPAQDPPPLLMFKPDCDVWIEVNDELFALDEVSPGQPKPARP